MTRRPGTYAGPASEDLQTASAGPGPVIVHSILFECDVYVCKEKSFSQTSHQHIENVMARPILPDRWGLATLSGAGGQVFCPRHFKVVEEAWHGTLKGKSRR